VAACLSTIGEHVFPILLFLGLTSRLSALGLLGMTMVIQLFVVRGGWPEHVLWLSLLTLIIARGPGAISLDHLIRNGALSVPALTRRAQA
jgi:putative oxidoreductase